MNSKNDYWLTNESWRVENAEIAFDMAIIEEYFRDLNKNDPKNYPLDVILYWQRISNSYGEQEAKKIFLARVRKIFDESTQNPQ